MIKILNKQGIKRNSLNLLKGIYKNPTVCIILNERWNVLPLLLLPLLLNIVLKVLVKAVGDKQTNESELEVK